jgi:hypothetical protein
MQNPDTQDSKKQHGARGERKPRRPVVKHARREQRDQDPHGEANRNSERSLRKEQRKRLRSVLERKLTQGRNDESNAGCEIPAEAHADERRE